MLMAAAQAYQSHQGGVQPLKFVDFNSNSRASGSAAQSCGLPTGTVDDDWMYAFVWHANSGAAAATIAGWAQVYFNNSANPTLTILKKKAASEGASVSVAGTTSGLMAIIIGTWRGGQGDVDVVGVIARATSATGVAASITPTVDGTLLAIFGTGFAGGTVTTPPTGMTLVGSVSATYGRAIYELEKNPPGASGSKTIVWSAVQVLGSILMQIK